MANDIKITLTINSKGQMLKHTAKQMKDLGKETEKTTKAQKKQGKERDNYNRREKGAAQLGMNQTKSFSKMNQTMDGGTGTGGLVRAYALLAANVFALTAAFGVLSRAAQVDVLTESMQILSTQGGQNIEVLSRKMKAASGNAIDLAQAFRQVSLASSAGLSTKEIEGLTLVAKGAAISLGRNLPDAMDRIFRGAIKLEPEILDEIGLFVRVDEAARKYGQTIGKSASALTQAEKRQAFLNEIIAQGTLKFSEFAERVDPDPYSRLAGALGDLAQSGLSKVNVLLGAVVGFLADNLPLLGVLFGALVISLIRKAVPALGQFNKGLAESAQEALEASNVFRDKYAKQLNEASQKAIKDIEKQIEKQKELRMEMSKKAPPNFASRAAGADEAAKKFDRATSAEGKSKANIERMNILKRAKLNKRLGDDSRKQIDREIAFRKKIEVQLQKEIALKQKIAEIEKNNTAELKKGTFAYREREQLQSRVASTAMVSNATNIGETEGVRKGFNALYNDLKKGETTVDGQKVKLTKMGSAMTAAKGSASLLSIGMSNLMAVTMPYIMAIGALITIVSMFNKFMGVGGKEAKKFEESLKNLDSTMEGLDDRFAEQVQKIERTNAGFLASAKGAKAFATTQKEVTDGLKENIEDFNNWLVSAGNYAKWWDNFKNNVGKGGLGLTNPLIANLLPDEMSFINTKEMDAEVMAGRAIINKYIGYVRAGANEQLQILDTVLEKELESSDFRKLVNDEAESAAAQLRDSENASADILKKNTSIQAVYGKAIRERSSIEDAAFSMYGRGSKILSVLDKNELQLLETRVKSSNIMKDYSESLKDISLELGLAEGLLTDLTDSEDENLRTLTALVSAYEGAQEAIGKFTSAFLPKTKVDDVTNTFRQMDEALQDATKSQREMFLTKIGDSPFATLLNKDEIKNIAAGGEEGLKVFQKVSKEFDDAQKSLQHLAQTQKTLNNLQKQYNKLKVKGGAQLEKELTLKLEDLKITEKMANIMFTTANRALQMMPQELRLLAARLRTAEDIDAFNAIADAQGIDRLEAAQLLQNFESLRTAEINKQIAEVSKEVKVRIEALKLSQEMVKVQRQLAMQALDNRKMTTENLRLGMLGTADLDPLTKAQTEIRSAKTVKDFELLVIKNKLKMIDLERKLLELRLKVLAKEMPSLFEGEGNSVKDIMKDFDDLQDLNKQFLKDSRTTVTLTYKRALREAIGGAFKSGDVTAGMAAAAKVFGKFVKKENRVAVEVGQDSDGNPVMGTSLSENPMGNDAVFMATRGLMDDLVEKSKAFGPEGEFVSNFTKGAMAIGDAFLDLRFRFEEISQITADMEEGEEKKQAERMGKSAAVAQAIGQSFAQVGDMLAANSKRKTAAIDSEIDAEKRRDGKSKESLAKIAAMEKKKEAIERKAFEQNKKVQMAVTIANTAAAIIGALAPSPVGFGNNPVGYAMAGLAAATGALQLAVISRQRYNGGSAGDIQAPKQNLTIGSRNNTVDVSRGATGGELGYLRNQRGMGTNANNFNSGAAGYKNYAAGGEGIVVGERGPEVITPAAPIDVIPNGGLRGTSNVNFTINAVDAAGVEQLLVEQRGNIIGMIREAAHDTGNDFLEDVDTQALGGSGAY